MFARRAEHFVAYLQSQQLKQRGGRRRARWTRVQLAGASEGRVRLSSQLVIFPHAGSLPAYWSAAKRAAREEPVSWTRPARLQKHRSPCRCRARERAEIVHSLRWCARRGHKTHGAVEWPVGRRQLETAARNKGQIDLTALLAFCACPQCIRTYAAADGVLAAALDPACLQPLLPYISFSSARHSRAGRADGPGENERNAAKRVTDDAMMTRFSQLHSIQMKNILLHFNLSWQFLKVVEFLKLRRSWRLRAFELIFQSSWKKNFLLDHLKN